MDTKKAYDNYNLWLDKVRNEEIKAQLLAMKGDEKTILNAFYKELEFGTGGLRGEIGAGTACLNIYTVGKATEGVARFMVKRRLRSVVISYDSRINSELFAKFSAKVLASHGITVHIVSDIAPTPFLSYSVRELKCGMGIMITASHNPAKYNGYKLFGSDGCQLDDDNSNIVKAQYIDKVDIFEVEPKEYDHYVNEKLIVTIGDEIVERYFKAVEKVSIVRANGIKIVYSPLNGAGYKFVPEILKRRGAEVVLVPEQAKPDGNFPTCPFPNPEKSEALKLGVVLAKNKKADLLIATDPDADRVGIAVRHNGDYRLLSGNEVGALLCDYLLGNIKDSPQKNKPLVIKTIVTSELGARIAESYGAEIYNVLTGFKYIGSKLEKMYQAGEAERFVLGFEESYGYLVGTHCRDKDAVVASMLIAEMCSKYKTEGKTLVDIIDSLYARFGYYLHQLITYEYSGASGNVKMKELLSKLRTKSPNKIGGLKVVRVIDYLTQDKLSLPKADVLQFDLTDGAQVIIRPSGTEPLIKVYTTSCCNSSKDNERISVAIKMDVDKLLGHKNAC